MKFHHSLAVIVGIDRYQSGISPLQTATADARAVAKILQDQHGYEVYLHLNEQAQRDRLSRSV